MPRNHNTGASTLRNRNRVTNKTRLKIFHGTIDADPLVLDEDEEKARVISTAGVDAEDANEHHLQAVLSAAQRNNSAGQRSTRGTVDKKESAPAYIPVPDSTGIIDDYDELYPQNRLEESATYIRSSETVEECSENALVNQFTYFMNERDKEWLDKNNEDARGEGTSAEGAMSSIGTTTRSGLSSRSAKARGKEPEVVQSVVVTEDEFELVMGLFEKVTHEKTEFLHHGLEQGMTFPPFSDYQDTFSSPLHPTFFTSFIVPTWIPPPERLARIARVIYPYWKERRIERGGHRVTPTLNFDESDTQNESYICFRRREVKTARKTRASQVTSSDKLVRLDNELYTALELANQVMKREMIKQECSTHGQQVWEKRLAVVELKRKYPSLGVKEDDELFYDKERIPKRSKVENSASRIGIRLRTLGDLASPGHVEVIRPKERAAMIKNQIEQTLLRLKERDHQWEDQVDNLYQSQPIPFSSRLFKYVPPTDSPQSPSPDATDEGPQLVSASRSVRWRYGRGGRLMMDRRGSTGRMLIQGLPRRRRSSSDSDTDTDSEMEWRLQDRWKFDADDEPSVGPDGSDEQDRRLIDDYNSRFLRQTMTLLHDQDLAALTTDPTLYLQTPDGRIQPVIPFKLGPQQPVIRRDPQRQYPPNAVPSISSAVQQAGVTIAPFPGNMTPISVQTHLKNMQSAAGLTQMRISSNGGMKPPNQPMVPNMAQPQQHSPPQAVATPTTNGVHVNRTSGSPAENDEAGSPAVPAAPNVNGVPSQLDNSVVPIDNNGVRHVSSSVPSKTPNQSHVVLPNGYLTAMNGYPLTNNSPYPRHVNGGQLSAQQVQNLKSAFANMPAGQDINGVQVNGQRLPASWTPNGGHFNMPLGSNVNMNLKLPSARWNGSSPQRPASALNGIDSSLPSAVNGSLSSSPRLGQSMPIRTPSANGGIRGVSVGHVISGLSQHSPPMIQSQLHPSPPRPPQTPNIAMASPSPQHLQPVGGATGGYS